ncbi:hypothetical protein [Sphingobacterium sp. SGG-5]|uniref:hypothetical protein n=1 Tax=Sphingobacterium sp. SGG-5 TaxID=2710881 RepID=UPI0013EA62BF|nr:hypothetical protein [Sphingobacterium sp. SGG-5]
MKTNFENEEEKVPQIVKDEPNDKPAGRGIMWSILIAIVILTLIYMIFFKGSIKTF